MKKYKKQDKTPAKLLEHLYKRKGQEEKLLNDPLVAEGAKKKLAEIEGAIQQITAMQQQANGDANGDQQMPMGYNGMNFKKYFHGGNHPTAQELKLLLANDAAYGEAGEEAMYQMTDTPESIENDMALWQEPTAKQLAIDNAASVWDYVGNDYNELTNKWEDPGIKTELSFPNSEPSKKKERVDNSEMWAEMMKNYQKRQHLNKLKELASNIYVEPKVHNPEEQTYRDYLTEIEQRGRKGTDMDTYYADRAAMENIDSARQAALQMSGGDPTLAMEMINAGSRSAADQLLSNSVTRYNASEQSKNNLLSLLDKLGAAKYGIGRDRQTIDRGYNQDYVQALSNRDISLADIEKNYLDDIIANSKDFYTYKDRQTSKDILRKNYPGYYPSRMKDGGRFKKYFK